MPSALASCNGANPVVAWAIGGEPFSFPPEAGYPFGNTDGGFIYGLMETHYDNYDQVSWHDTSGVRIWYLEGADMRQYDAGIATFGAGGGFSVPALNPSYTHSGICPGSCTNNMDVTEVNVFATQLHAHLIGRKLVAKHIRSGVELAPIANEPHYDFNFQNFDIKRKPYPKIKRGDTIDVQCTFDSSGRSTVTQAGLGATNEMCLMCMCIPFFRIASHVIV